MSSRITSSWSLSQRRWHCLMIAILMYSAAAANAQQQVADTARPSMLFTQMAWSEKHTRAYALGAAWDWHWRRQYSFGTVTGYSEITFGRWVTQSDARDDSAWVTQLGMTPVLRLQPRMFAADLFLELGVGANLILPLYRTDDKRFSTRFNFGDHLALGWQFGNDRTHELALRVQHFSNAGIKDPNPGENFIQLRYSRRW